MTTESDRSVAEAGQSASDDYDAYRVTLDRERCTGIFACLVRDDRFVEAADGLATIDDAGGGERSGDDLVGGSESDEDATTITASFEDDRLEDARQAADACPVDAIDVELLGAAGGETR